MDGQRPEEELSEALVLTKVLGFRTPEEGDRVFVVEEIPAPSTTTTVVRPMSKEDRAVRRAPYLPKARSVAYYVQEPGCRRLELESHWEGLLAEALSSPEKDATNSSPRLLLIFARPEAVKRRLLDHDFSRQTGTLEMPTDSGPVQRTWVTRVATTARSTIVGSLDGCRTIASSFLLQRNNTLYNEKADKGSPGEDFKVSTGAASESRDHRKKLRNMPFTLKTFRTVARRMSIHSWICRVISRADVQLFEPTITEMPLYSSTGESTGSQQAIIYNWRSSNAWENDMALTATHFPKQRLTFAIVFGSCPEQERNILARLRKAGEDTAHPMLLPGVLAELERIRQMEAIEERIDDLETQIFLLDNETVTTRNRSGSTKAERNRQKTKAWLNATFARNLLLGYRSLLIKMLNHVDEFPVLVNHHPPPRVQMGHQGPSSREPASSKIFCPGAPHSVGSTGSSNNKPRPAYDGHSRRWTDTETITAEPEKIHVLDKYQRSLRQAGVRMKDRLVALIDEYDDKIRDCTMRVDNMAMATQWSHGETNMEIATAAAADSSQMRSIALVTMVFLPGTFFASLFSMTFFNWTPGSGGNGPTVSGYIWVYFFVTGAFTALTLALFWYFVLGRRNRRRS